MDVCPEGGSRGPSSQNGGPHRELHSSPRTIWGPREEEEVKLNLIFKPLRRRRGQLSVFSMLGLLIEKKERESRVDVFGFGPG
jgi:hypothetical protein